MKARARSYGFDYLDDDGWHSNIHCFTTRKEAEAYLASMRPHLGGKETRIVPRADDPAMGWLHGRMVHLYPMEFCGCLAAPPVCVIRERAHSAIGSIAGMKTHDIQRFWAEYDRQIIPLLSGPSALDRSVQPFLALNPQNQRARRKKTPVFRPTAGGGMMVPANTPLYGVRVVVNGREGWARLPGRIRGYPTFGEAVKAADEIGRRGYPAFVKLRDDIEDGA